MRLSAGVWCSQTDARGFESGRRAASRRLECAQSVVHRTRSARVRYHSSHCSPSPVVCARGCVDGSAAGDCERRSHARQRQTTSPSPQQRRTHTICSSVACVSQRHELCGLCCVAAGRAVLGCVVCSACGVRSQRIVPARGDARRGGGGWASRACVVLCVWCPALQPACVLRCGAVCCALLSRSALIRVGEAARSAEKRAGAAPTDTHSTRPTALLYSAAL